MNIEVIDFSLTNALIVIDYFDSHGVCKAESFPLDEFELFIDSNSYLEYHHFKQRMDGQHEEVEGQITWERYISEFISESDVLDFLKWKIK